MKKARHGYSGTKTYKAWADMWDRCRRPKNPRYEAYGGRGITVCFRWRWFINFVDDMGEAPEGMSIDRIDNNGNYCPENCRWATNEEQCNNKKNNIVLELNGVSHTLAEWSDISGIHRSTILRRLKLKWTLQQALEKAPRVCKSNGVKHYLQSELL